MPTFSDLLAALRTDGANTYSVDWGQGRTLHGGLTAALITFVRHFHPIQALVRTDETRLLACRFTGGWSSALNGSAPHADRNCWSDFPRGI
jgi:hypothetical protein